MNNVVAGGRREQGASVAVEAVNELQARMRGRVLLPASARYDEARTIWNAMIDRRPALIARCVGASDVMRAIGFARAQALAVAIRGGGHNIAGKAVCDGGLMIDLSQMKSVRINPQARRAYVEGGATLADFDHEAQNFGLATPLGINSTTGVAGLTLGGGFGWLSRVHGLTVDNLVAADVVTADGKMLRADAEQNPDLFWALRGGGGNFGVVTGFEFQLHPVGPEVFGGLVVFPFDQGKSLLTQYRALVETLPDEANVWALIRKAPPLPFLPTAVHGKEVVVFVVFHTGGVAKGDRLFDQIRGFGTPHGEHGGPVPYVAWQQMFDPLLSFGARNYWKTHNFARLDDGAIDTLLNYAAALPSPSTEIFVGLLGAAIGRVASDATAYAERDARLVMNVHGRWDDPADDVACIAWAREVFDAAAPYATGGAYVNFLTDEETERIPAAYGKNYDRLVQVKTKFDPENFFRQNQNIRPQAVAAKR